MITTRQREEPLAGLRKAQRDRICWALRRLIESGSLNRKDVMAFGEVSTPQASIDLREILARLPGVMTYDKKAKAYRPTTEAAEIVSSLNLQKGTAE